MDEVQTMRFHGPGWTLELEAAWFKVWGPQPAAEYPACAGMVASSKPPRDHWAAAWGEQLDEDAGEEVLPDGDFRRGASLEEVLAIFPARVAARFREVIS